MNAQTMELFVVSGSPYGWRAQLALEVKGLSYTLRYLSASDGETQSAQFLALNPRGKIPVLRDRDCVVYESLAIFAYLERIAPEPSLLGRSAAETGHVWQRLCEFESYASFPMRQIILPLYFGTAEARAAEMRRALPKVHKELALLERRLQNDSWLVADKLSAADLAIYPFLKSSERAAAREGAGDFDLQLLPIGARYPKLGALMARVEALPGYARTYPPHWREE